MTRRCPAAHLTTAFAATVSAIFGKKLTKIVHNQE
jgi:hypothetical protein